MSTQTEQRIVLSETLSYDQLHTLQVTYHTPIDQWITAYEPEDMEHYIFCLGWKAGYWDMDSRKEYQTSSPVIPWYSGCGSPDLNNLVFMARLHEGDDHVQARAYANAEYTNHTDIWNLWVEGYNAFFEAAKN